MDSEAKELLQANLELVKDNNKMLHSIKRSMRMSRVMSYVYWAFIIGSALGAYYIAQPYIDQVLKFYSGANDTLNSIKNFGR